MPPSTHAKRLHHQSLGLNTWVRGLLARRPAKVAAVALANKTARIAWAVMARGEAYRATNEIVQAA